MKQQDPPRLVLGHVIRAHGVHGAILLAPYTESSQTILEGHDLFLLPPDNSSLPPFPIESLKGKEANQGLILKIKNINSRETAAEFKGFRLAILRKNLPDLTSDEVYLADLIGLMVQTLDGQNIGAVENFMETPAIILSIRTPDGREVLVPYAFVCEYNLPMGFLTIDPPEGLLELF